MRCASARSTHRPTVAYLASDDAGYVTASAFPLDGGITAAYTIPS